MDFFESVASGLLVALVLGLTRRGLARRHRLVPPTDHRQEIPMGRPGQFRRPQLAPGSHQELLDLLYDLHRQAGGRLSVRRLAECTGLPHSTVHKALTHPDLPGLHAAVAIGLALADEVLQSESDTDRETYLDDVDRQITDLWRAASQEGAPPTGLTVRAAVERAWAVMARPLWGVETLLTQAVGRCSVLSTTMRAGVVSVAVAAPDREALRLVCEPASWHVEFGRLVSQYLQYHVGLSLEVDLRDGRPRPPLRRRKVSRPREERFALPRLQSDEYITALLATLDSICRCGGHTHPRECWQARSTETPQDPTTRSTPAR
ncbi:hypothetical protein [Streptomyces sp. NBC_00019]|uniref:hypothetical protein n=1 Tax=Streptomyces sp. NBC_00019 TaxID=2975623 RepID=UPI002F91ACEA